MGCVVAVQAVRQSCSVWSLGHRKNKQSCPAHASSSSSSSSLSLTATTDRCMHGPLTILLVRTVPTNRCPESSPDYSRTRISSRRAESYLTTWQQHACRTEESRRTGVPAADCRAGRLTCAHRARRERERERERGRQGTHLS